jgi:membrane protein implicated in regulation of membrane protease activity
MQSSTVGFVNVGLAAGAMALVVWVSDVSTALKVTGVLVGLGLGAVAGAADARGLERRVDHSGGILLYAQDTAPSALLWPLGALALSPFAFGAVTRGVVRSPELQLLLQVMLIGMTAAWLAHDVSMARALRRVSANRGPLQVQWFHSRSVVGPEGMPGKTGEMTSSGASGDYVRIAGELWRSESIDCSRLSAGQRVIVRRVHGLLLVVEAVGARPDDRRADAPRITQ